MQFDPSRIAYDLEQQSAEHPAKETPCLVSNPQTDLGKQDDGEHCNEKSIAGQRGEVKEVGLEQGASGECTIIIWDDGIGDETHRDGLRMILFIQEGWNQEEVTEETEAKSNENSKRIRSSCKNGAGSLFLFCQAKEILNNLS